MVQYQEKKCSRRRQRQMYSDFEWSLRKTLRFLIYRRTGRYTYRKRNYFLAMNFLPPHFTLSRVRGVVDMIFCIDVHPPAIGETRLPLFEVENAGAAERYP